jgi:hypothetical protein
MTYICEEREEKGSFFAIPTIKNNDLGFMKKLVPVAIAPLQTDTGYHRHQRHFVTGGFGALLL